MPLTMYIVLSCQFLKKENMNPAKEFNFLQCYVAALAGLYIINHTFCSVVLRSQISTKMASLSE